MDVTLPNLAKYELKVGKMLMFIGKDYNFPFSESFVHLSTTSTRTSLFAYNSFASVRPFTDSILLKPNHYFNYENTRKNELFGSYVLFSRAMATSMDNALTVTSKYKELLNVFRSVASFIKKFSRMINKLFHQLLKWTSIENNDNNAVYSPKLSSKVETKVERKEVTTPVQLSSYSKIETWKQINETEQQIRNKAYAKKKLEEIRKRKKEQEMKARESYRSFITHSIDMIPTETLNYKENASMIFSDNATLAEEGSYTSGNETLMYNGESSLAVVVSDNHSCMGVPKDTKNETSLIHIDESILNDQGKYAPWQKEWRQESVANE